MTVGNSANLVTAVFETLGYAYQSYILRTLGQFIAQPVATVLFVGLAISLIVSFLLTGKGARPVIWTLLAPAVLWSILFNRTETTGPSWKFGRELRSQAQVNYETRKALEGRDGQPRGMNREPIQVSSLFAYYNRVVSSLTSEVVHVLAGAKGKIDGRFILRTELAAKLRGSQISDPRLQAFIQQIFIRGCADMIRSAREIPPGAVRGLNAGNANVALDQFEAGLQSQVSLRLDLAHQQTVNVREQLVQSRELLQHLQGTYPAHFTAALTNTPEQYGGYLQRSFQPLTEVAARTETVSTQPVPEVLTCTQVWNITHLGLLHFASMENEKYKSQSRALLGDDTALLKDLTLIKPPTNYTNPQGLTGNRAEFLHLFNRVLASYFLRNELSRASTAGFVSNYSKKGFEFSVISVPGEIDMSAVERSRNEINEVTERTGLFTVLASLPYYQGLMLYILSALFPFFSVLILIPSRIKSFLLWFFLWFWIKSWDIGFALVMLFDDILFTLFSGAKTNPEELFKLGLDAPFASVLWSLKELDPSFQLGVYYTLISAALAAVPTISSLLILGSLRGGANLVVDGAGNLAGTLKGAADGVFTQRFSDDLRKSISLARMRRAERLYDATLSNIQADFGPDQRPTPRGLDYPYQAGNHLNQPTGDSMQKYLNLGTEAGQKGGTLPLNSFDKAISDQTRDASPVNALNDFTNYAQYALRNEQSYSRRDKALLDADQKYLRTAIETDFAKRMGTVNNESYLVPSSERAIARGMVAKTIGNPATPEDGDEEKMLRAQFALYAEGKMRDLAPVRIRAELTTTSIQDYLDGYSNRMNIESLRDMNRNSDRRAERQQWPVVGTPRISQRFNPPTNPQHNGLDIVIDGGATDGAPVRPSEPGHIVFRGWIDGYGNTIIVQHGDDLRTLYAHLSGFGSDAELKSPEPVDENSVIGFIGDTGRSRGAHLHFEAVAGFNEFFYLNPEQYLSHGDRLPGAFPLSERNPAMARHFQEAQNFYRSRTDQQAQGR